MKRQQTLWPPIVDWAHIVIGSIWVCVEAGVTLVGNTVLQLLPQPLLVVTLLLQLTQKDLQVLERGAESPWDGRRQASAGWLEEPCLLWSEG